MKYLANPPMIRQFTLAQRTKNEIRLMWWLLDEDAQKNQLSKKKNKNGEINNDDILRSMFNVFVTNIVKEELPVQQGV